MNPDSIEFHYQALELPEDADFAAARKHFRKLAQRLHPDLPGGDTERFQRVQRAYEFLRRYHRDHGALPLQATRKPVTLAPGQGIRRRAVHKKRFWQRRRILLVAASAGALVWLASRPDPGAPPEALPAPAVEPAVLATPALLPSVPRKTFDIGDSLADVIEIQGVPDARQESSWFYGQSRVDFIDGKVAGWYEHPDTPLHINHTRALNEDAISDPARTAPLPPSATGS